MKNELTKDLEDLLEDTLKDKKGYEQAKNDTDNEHLKVIFNDLAEQKSRAALEIKEVLSSYGVKSETRENIASEKDESSKMFSSLFTNKGEKSVIEACMIRENAVSDRYKKLMVDYDQDSSLQALLKKQHEESIRAKAILWEQSAKYKSFTI